MYGALRLSRNYEQRGLKKQKLRINFLSRKNFTQSHHHVLHYQEKIFSMAIDFQKRV